MAKVIKQGIIHRIAHCRDCSWANGDFNNALSLAKRHADSTGHTIDIETGSWTVVSSDKKK
ncbi:MAG: hypothetical protein WC310_05490 [Patescibacteria group bacterium]|jgi:hypothetical protein